MRHKKTSWKWGREEGNIWQEIDDKIGKMQWVKTSTETNPKKLH